MLIVRTVDLKNNMSELFNNIVNNHEKLMIVRPKNKNVVIFSEERANELEKKEKELALLLKK
ncbi:hypothetical protein IR145_02855 [Streptococcus danieliae]|nr:hypothetical protein [Streptococcus danieliae]